MAKKKESSPFPLVADPKSPAVETHKKSKSNKVADEAANASPSTRLSDPSPSLSKKQPLETPDTITKAKHKVAVEKKKSAPSAKESKISTKTAAANQEPSNGSEAVVKKTAATKKTAAASPKKTAAAKKETVKKVAVKAAEETEAPAAKKVSKAAAAKGEDAPVEKKKTSSSKVKAEAPAKETKKAKAVKETAKVDAKADSKISAPAKISSPAPAPKVAADEIEIRQAYDPKSPPTFVLMQKDRLIELRSSLIDSMDGVVKEVLSSRPEGSDGSVGGMHMGDAGSDAYDRDFALSMLSKEQDALHEINEALLRIDQGVYGVCEMSALPINEERLEALPYTRYTREMQEVIEKEQLGGRFKRPVVRSVFGLDEDGDEDDDDDEEGSSSTSTSNSDSSLDFGKD